MDVSELRKDVDWVSGRLKNIVIRSDKFRLFEISHDDKCYPVINDVPFQILDGCDGDV